MLTIILHILLSIFLFFLINWIGKHSLQLGYVELSVFEKSADAPAFNFAIRFAGPLIFIVVVSTVLIFFGWDFAVLNIYLVNVYYFIFRSLFNLALERKDLVNWKREILTALSSIIASYLIYSYLISIRQRLVPDLNTIANELWVIIIIFIYSVLNGVETNSTKVEYRRKLYRIKRYLNLKAKYSDIVDSVSSDKNIILLIYAVMIYESFNRPWIARQVENYLLFPLRKSSTLGLMQVKTNQKRINDQESVSIGAAKIATDYERFKRTEGENYYSSKLNTINYDVRRKTLAEYNRDDSYIDEVEQIFDALCEDVLFKSDTELEIELRGGLRITPKSDSDSYRRIIKVNNVYEFLGAIGNDRIIELSSGEYLLDELTKYNTLRHINWREEHDGYALILTEVNNLTIRGQIGTIIIVSPRYIPVLVFDRCTKIQLENIYFGHTPDGTCTGSVIEISETLDLKIKDCNLFGCGSEALKINRVINAEVIDCKIYDCTYGIASIANSENVIFSDSHFYNNKEFYGLSISHSQKVHFINCIFENNKITGNFFEISLSDDIQLIGSTFIGNTFQEIGGIQIDESSLFDEKAESDIRELNFDLTPNENSSDSDPPLTDLVLGLIKSGIKNNPILGNHLGQYLSENNHSLSKMVEDESFQQILKLFFVHLELESEMTKLQEDLRNKFN